ncbi:hypothetical protein D9M68_869490 [compost metagenome]
MDEVVAVHGVFAEEVAKAQEDLDGHVLAQHVDVLATLLVGRNGDVLPLHRLADDASLLEVDMDGVVPAIFGVHQLPHFRAVLAYPRADKGRVKEPAIHRPHAVLAFEYPTPHRRGGNFFWVERAQRP